jgi:hypothetical protein
MFDSKLVEAVIATTGSIAVAALTGFGSYALAKWNTRKDLELELRRQRLDAFKKLWTISQPLAKWGSAEPVTPAVVARLSRDLCKWYFEEGGMFLTDSSRDAYFRFQESLQSTIESNAKSPQSSVLDATVFESLRQKGSDVRTTLRAAFSGFPQM